MSVCVCVWSFAAWAYTYVVYVSHSVRDINYEGLMCVLCVYVYVCMFVCVATLYDDQPDINYEGLMESDDEPFGIPGGPGRRTPKYVHDSSVHNAQEHYQVFLVLR